MALPTPGPSRRTIIVLALLSVTLITVDLRGSELIDGSRAATTELTSPLAGFFRFLARPAVNAWNGMRSYEELELENAQLRDKVEAQEGAAIAAEAKSQLYDELKAVAGLDLLGNYPYVTAQVVGEPASNLQLAVEIDKGARDGLAPGMPVVTAGGLVGRLSQVTPTHSFIRMLYDPQIGVPVKIIGTRRPAPGATTTTTSPPTATTTAAPSGPKSSTTGAVTGDPSAETTVPATTTTTVPPKSVLDTGLLKGQGYDRPLAVDLVGAGESVAVGDAVTTYASSGSLFPEDIPIGRVKTVRPRPGSTYLDVLVEPIADLRRLSFVRVIKYSPTAGG
ncbi:MAG: rod shape-determining protein MreC [Acidimicrobiales bacterium]